MASRVDIDIIRENLRDINKISEIKENKFILTCRTHFFRDQVQTEVLTDFDILYIPEWGEGELKEYLQKRFGNSWEHHLERISGTHNLPELAQTPLFLEMIVETLPQLGDEVKRIELYQAYTDKWIKDQSRRKGARLLAEQRSQFVKELAMKLYLEGKLSCHHTEFVPLLRKRFEIDDAAQMDYLRSDVQTCTFLTRDGQGNYGFRHKSFMEFFVAQTLTGEVREGNPEHLSAKLLPIEVRGFLIDHLSIDPPAHLLKEWLRTTAEEILRDNVLSLLPRLKINISDTQLYSETDKNSEAQIGALFLQGSTEAFSHLYTSYKKSLENYVRRFRIPAYAVEDIVIDTFLKAWQMKERLDNVANIRFYLQRVAYRESMDYIRHNKLEGNAFSIDELTPESIDELPIVTKEDPETFVAVQELKEALKSLPARERQILLLMAEGTSSSEIGRALGLTSSQVRKIRMRAFERLKKHLKSN